MNVSGNGASIADKKLGAAKVSLNPNAAEFVPFSLRSPAAGVSSLDASSKFATFTPAATLGKSILDRSESSVSNNSEEEAQQYWRNQLPDDIIPDFNVLGIDDTQGINGLSSADVTEGFRYSATTRSGFMVDQQGLSNHSVNGAEKPRYPVASYGEYPSPRNFQPSLAQPWEKQIIGKGQLLSRHAPPYDGNSRHNFVDEFPNEQLMMENTDASPFEFLASQFPGFATDSLAEVYFANGGDMNLTFEMLTQIEMQLQVDRGLNQTLNSKPLSAPNLRAMDFPALTNGQNGLSKIYGDDLHQTISPFCSSEKESPLLFRSNSSISSRGAPDFASAVRKMPPQESSIWKYNINGSPDASIGTSRSSQVLASSYNSGQGRGIFGDRLQNQGSTRASPFWLETGEAVASMYSETLEEAREHARVRNAYLEQARQAYLIDNKVLAKELSIKGHLHNMQMKAAHGKAQESIYCQRNSDMQGNGRERMIDLHGLHVNEAIHVLKRELAVMKNVARSADQQLVVYIFVGTGHHTRGACTPARLPTAVQRYLLEEGLDFSEPQPGLLRVMIY